ncbi:glycoside hydrolase family 76 protein [Paenibacillus guangzhouensis]|uniref:glycoside hydrolase family 76 protein n=1 Tax=Paenibacillus guangzhouensis TaxID=1473112 RepID=UPI001266B563|nr:glycoside hydrolase family 76 protein [Paenibacillus guangzhouensis]
MSDHFKTLGKLVIAGMTSLLVVSSASVTNANAFVANEADSVITNFNNQFYDSTSKQFKETNGSNGLINSFWETAEIIELIEDAYDRTHSNTYKQQVIDLYDGVVARWGTNWLSIPGFGDYNDDMIWMTIASLRAYQITGDTKYRTQAKSIFDQVWARAYDTVLGGGLWWNTSKHEKNTCIVAPAGIAAVLLSDALNDSTYLTKASTLYTWLRGTLFNTSTGSVGDNKNLDGTIDYTNYTYNQGTFIGLAHLLYKKTGTTSYYNDALLSANFTKNNMTAPGTDVLRTEEATPDQPGFKGIFARYAARFAVEYNLSDIISWLQNNANTVYNHRNSLGITYHHFPEFLTTSTTSSWGASGGAVLMQVVPPDGLIINLTLNKTASSNGNVSGETPTLGVDGAITNNSKWCGNASGDKWLSVDLGASHTISRWEVQHAGAGGETSAYNTRNFKLQKSTDGTNWIDVDTVTGNTANQTIRQVASFTARYVRLYVTQAEQNGNGAARIYEFEVLGN